MQTARLLVALPVALLLGVASIASALDRADVQNGLSALLPTLLRGAANTRAAQAALDDRRPADALRFATAAVVGDPLNADAIAALGAAQIATGNDEDAFNSFTVAGGRGWRNSFVQQYWLAAALDAGDVGVAAQRLDALLRLGVTAPLVTQALYLLETTPKGQTALARRLAANPAWAATYVGGMRDLDMQALTNRLLVLTQAADSGLSIECDSVAVAAAGMFDKGEFARSAGIWKGMCAPNTHRATIVDGGFENGVNAPVGVPFEWEFLSAPGVEATLAPAPPPLRGRALSIRIQRSIRQTVAVQSLTLAPGRYRVTARIVDDQGRAADGLAITVQCLTLASAPRTASVPLLEPQTPPFLLDVAERGCSAQRLRVVALPVGSGIAATRWIDDIAIAGL